MHDLSGARWVKAARSNPTGDNCVELAELSGTVGVRDSKNPTGPVLALTPQQWQKLTARIRRSEFDL